jgi:hypothetical protein
MCIVIAGETQPDTTKLINVPVTIDAEKYNFFMYINNFDLQNKKFIKKKNVFREGFLHFNSDGNNYKRNNNNFSNRFMDSINITNSLGNYATFEINSNSSNNSIMVVPFPVQPHTIVSKIGLVDISTDSMKELRTSIKNLNPNIPKTFSNSYSLSTSFDEYSDSLEVHKIGNYNISVATTYNQLLDRIDWTKFNKPDNFEKRMQTFRNPNLYPRQFGYFYVVAEAIENIKDDGFGVVYPQLPNNIIYLPTAHEDTEEEHYFDVEMYTFGYEKYDKDFDISYLHSRLEKLKNQPVKMLGKNPTNKLMSFDKDISSFRFLEEKKNMKNHNIFLRNN